MRAVGLYGGQVLDVPGNYVEPTLVRVEPGLDLLNEEHFYPILFIMTYTDIDEAIQWNNQVKHGLSSTIFAEDMSVIEQFVSAAGTVVLQMSIWVLLVRRLAALLVAKSIPVAAVKRAPMLGRPTCDDKLSVLIEGTHCHWRKVLISQCLKSGFCQWIGNRVYVSCWLRYYR